jgi:hypothetical protein
MFAIKLGLFSIGTIVVPTWVWLYQLVKLITPACLNLVEHVYVLVELEFVLPIFVWYIGWTSIYNTCSNNYTFSYFQTTFIKDFLPTWSRRNGDWRDDCSNKSSKSLHCWMELSLKKSNCPRSTWVLKKTCNRLKTMFDVEHVVSY